MSELAPPQPLDRGISGAATRVGEPSAASTSVRLKLLDGFALTRGDASVLVPSGAQQLLAFLAITNRAVRRAQIAGTLWQDVTDDRAAGNLRSAIWRLRQLGPELVDSSGVWLSVSAGIGVDIRELESLGRVVMDPSSDVASLDLDGLPLRGELLPGWSSEWVLLERERQRQISLHILEALCERWTAGRQYDKAVRAGLAAVAGEPLRESSNRALIAAFLAEGNPTEAIRHFNIYRALLSKELNLGPSLRLVELVMTASDPVTGR